MIQAGVDRQAIEPGTELGFAAEGAGMAPGLEKDLLGQILGVLAVAGIAVSQIQHLALVPPHQFGESFLTAGHRPGKKLLVRL